MHAGTDEAVVLGWVRVEVAVVEIVVLVDEKETEVVDDMVPVLLLMKNDDEVDVTLPELVCEENTVVELDAE